MKKKRITIKGKQATYYESRDNGQAVILVHGFSSCSSIFIRQLIDSVLSYQYRLIAVDFIGHGNADVSDKPERDYTINGLGEFLVDFTSALGIDEAVYVGHNVGANIIIEAINKLRNPIGLVLLSAIPFSNPISMGMFINEDFLSILSKAGVDDSEVHQMASWFVEKDTVYPDFIPEVIRKADIKTREILFGSINKGEFEDQLKRLKELKIPIASYIGENDQIFDIEHFKNISMPTLWQGNIQIIKNAGHIFFYENPADFNVSFESYLNSVFN
ncbi:MAG: alpha/beta hydrolase [Bacteroidales bacterium]|nr:alpha/beta hydrolase [Bacteroidales bacterium]